MDFKKLGLLCVYLSRLWESKTTKMDLSVEIEIEMK